MSSTETDLPSMFKTVLTTTREDLNALKFDSAPFTEIVGASTRKIMEDAKSYLNSVDISRVQPVIETLQTPKGVNLKDQCYTAKCLLHRLTAVQLIVLRLNALQNGWTVRPPPSTIQELWYFGYLRVHVEEEASNLFNWSKDVIKPFEPETRTAK
ncbi:hypothetical protein BDV25DRAFT_138239 [Aspergillus avenaceus]|uniref:Uncharacterized protein n=1 Tax=Aspergillus avenaceus TaxID=36643 RepID=A0A5N6U0G3_ASPAV|nr:hypothetical protein BDV25DRAFT_138239 [Aspergillus avenaceus]